MADEYLAHVAELTGLQHYPKQGPFGQKDGAAMGTREGYIVAIGPAKDKRGRAGIAILVRFRKVDQATTVRSAVEENAAVAQALGTDKLSSSQRKQLDVTDNTLIWTCSYSLRKPKAEEVASLTAALVNALKNIAAPLGGHCESCQSSSPAIVLLNSIPTHYCSGCQLKAQQELDKAAYEYENMPSNLPRGLLFGVVAALAGSLAWGLVAYALNRIFLWGAILIGVLVAKALFVGMGKVTRAGQIAVALLTLASVLFGDVLFYTLSVMRELKLPFSTDLMAIVLRNFWRIETSSEGGVFSLIFALIGAGYILYTARKPAFKAKFEPLGTPSVKTTGVGAAF